MKITKLLPVIIILLICIIVFTDIYENFVGCYSIHTGKKINAGVGRNCDSNHCYCFNGTASDDSMCSVATTEHCNSCNQGYIHINNLCLTPSRLTYEYSIEGGWAMRGDSENQFSKITDGIKHIFCRGNNILITSNNGDVWVHGDNYNNKLGLPVDILDKSETEFVKINIENVKKTVTAENYTLYLKEDGSLYISGGFFSSEFKAQFFSEDIYGDYIYEPAQTSLPNDIIDIVALRCGMLILLHNDRVSHYIYDISDSYGYGFSSIDLNSLNNIEKIQGCNNTCFFINSDGTVYVLVLIASGWRRGGQYFKEAGDFSSTTTTPHQIQGLSNIKDIKIYEHTALFLTINGEVYITGNNYISPHYFIKATSGLSDDIIPYPSKIKISSSNALTDVKEIAIGHTHALFLKNNGEVYAFGANYYFQIDNYTNYDNYNYGFAKKINKYNNISINRIFASDSGSLFVKINYT